MDEPQTRICPRRRLLIEAGRAPSIAFVLETLRKPGTVWLDASLDPRQESTGDRPVGSASYLFHDPIDEIVAWDLDDVGAALLRLDSSVKKGLFVAGYVAYEAGLAFEKPSSDLSAPPDFEYPLVWFGVYTSRQTVSGPLFDVTLPSSPAPTEGEIEGLKDLDSPEHFENAVSAIRDLIAEGDVYQINMTTRFRGELKGSALDLYSKLRARQSVKYGAFLNTQWGQFLSFSPELFFERKGNRITTRPMKGTAPRGGTPDLDRKMASWLQNDPKNRAENLMIVDLLRNDLSKICEVGSVQVPQLFEVESLSTVHQMSSEVVGELRPNVGLEEILRSLFPCGSITGAPKIRAMQRIGELESRPRGIYCGAIGFAGPDPDSPKKSTSATFSVAIRTASVQGNQFTYGAGGGIVWDSVPADEREEAYLKTRFLTDVERPQIELIETMKWSNGIEWLDFHLDRLRDSAKQLGYEWDESKVVAAINAYTKSLLQGEVVRLRLTMDAKGTVKMTSKSWSLPISPLKIGLSTQRVASTYPLLQHKTTDRGAYNRALAEAHAKGWFDAILTNERGEITEGAITNIFIQKDGFWITPPLPSGLLPGVGRRVFMLKNGARERKLTVQDLQRADKIVVTNALIGALEAEWCG